jgi:TolA-binding protein
MRPGIRRALLSSLALVALGSLPGCVYYNKFYSAKKNFNDAEKLFDRPDGRATPQQIQLYDKSLKSATKVVVEHPTSSWVDDAILLMGRAMLGKGDYAKAREKFEELYDNFPKSELTDQALFYHGEAYRREREWLPALSLYDSVTARFPKSKMTPAIHIQQGKIFVQQSRYPRAIALLQPAAERGGAGELEARLALAEAYFGLERYDSAAVEFAWVARKTKSAELRNECVFRQGEALEASSDFAGAIQVYEDWAQQTTNLTYRDQAQIRAGSAMALSGDPTGGIHRLETVIAGRRRSLAAAEALFQIGYIQEVFLDDFVAARSTYAKVEEEARNSTFAQQAKQRLENLSRIEALRSSAASDTSAAGGPAGAAFTLAEHYLFEVRNPARALTEYEGVEREFPASPYAPKAAFAGAWILERKLERPAAAESAWRHVAETYPETEHGRAAAAFLAGEADSLRATDPLETVHMSHPYTPGATPYVKPAAKLDVARGGSPQQRSGRAAATVDSLAHADSLRLAAERAREPEVALADTLAPSDSAAWVDTTRSEPAPPDTSGGAAPDSAKAEAPGSASLGPGGAGPRPGGATPGCDERAALARAGRRDHRGRHSSL